MNQQLTQKQIAARAYYQAHKEIIKAQKRAKYAPTAQKQRVIKIANSSTASTSTTAPKATTVRFQLEQKIVSASVKISAEDKARFAKRRSIEDIKLANELGLSLEDLQ
ncbi:MAG: hypothetical protein ACRC1W_16895 [Shewanella sp.]